MLEPQTHDDLIKWATRLRECQERITQLLAYLVTHNEKDVPLNIVKAETALAYLETWSKDNLIKFEKLRAKKVAKEKSVKRRENKD